MLYLDLLQRLLRQLAELPSLQAGMVGTILPPDAKAPALTLTLQEPEENGILAPTCWHLTLSFWVADPSLQDIYQQREETLGVLKNMGAIKVIEQKPPTYHPAGGLTQTLLLHLFTGNSHA